MIESPLKMMKNALYFILKVFFFLEIFKLLSRLFGHVGKTLNSKFMTSQPGLQTIAIHMILPNISQSFYLIKFLLSGVSEFLHHNNPASIGKISLILSQGKMISPERHEIEKKPITIKKAIKNN